MSKLRVNVSLNASSLDDNTSESISFSIETTPEDYEKLAKDIKLLVDKIPEEE